MKICGISDMHGKLKINIEPCDIVMICGDIVPLNIQKYDSQSEEWFGDKFIPWCKNLPCEKVLFIAGNHDFFLMEHPDIIRRMLRDQDKIIYLDCETYEYQGKVIYGTPLCKPFGRWAFMISYEEQDARYERHLNIIGKIDIVMSHDSPYGVSDVLLQKDCTWADGSHIGNESLRKFIEKAQPELMLHGHLHSTNHKKEMLGNTAVYNVSVMDEFYYIKYKPLYIEI